MTSREDLQGFIDRLEQSGGLSSQEVESGLWVLSLEDRGEIVVDYEPPVVVIRVHVMELPPQGDKQNQLMKVLLELNAKELVHGSYGIEDARVVLTDTLQLENLDFDEFQASIESITLALAQHLRTLAPYRE